MYCIVAMVDHTLWATLSVLLGSDAKVYKKLHGICMNIATQVSTNIL